MIDLVGYIGSICFAICGIPPAVEAIRKGYCEYPKSFLWLWFIGEIATTIYVIAIAKYILLINYIVNLLCLMVLLWKNRSR